MRLNNTGTVAGLLSVVCLLAVLPAPPANERAQPQEVELQAKVVCLPEAMHQLYQAELRTDHEHVYGLETPADGFYTLLRTKFSDSLFTDPQLRGKTLLLKGRVFPKSRLFEVTRTRSLQNGVVFDLHYYCTVCSIESVTAGDCACCWQPVELVEKPLFRTKREP